MNLEEKTNEYLEILTQDYDIEDLTGNDSANLEALAVAKAQLDRYNDVWEEYMNSEKIPLSDINTLRNIISSTRQDIIRIEDSLGIQRKNRKKEEESLVEYLKSVKKRARSFLEERLSQIYCPECSTLVASMWLLSYDLGSRFKFICPFCSNDFLVEDFELKNRKNLDDKLLPRGVD